MTDEILGPDPDGQAEPSAPAQESGQPAESSATTDSKSSTSTSPEPDASAEDSFFDPRDIADKPELMKAYRQMQSAFTKKTQEISQFKRVHDAYRADPVGLIQQEAARMGYRLTRAEAQQIEQKQTAQPEQNWEPQTWEEVLARAEERAERRIMQRFAPMLDEVTGMKKTAVEAQLDRDLPEWREYEPRMIELVQKHPSLAQDMESLLELAVPKEIRDRRAEAAAIKRIEARSKAASVNGTSTTKHVPEKKPASSLREAVALAQEELEAKGIKPPPGFRL